MLALLKHVEELTENQFSCYIAGGWLRDTEHGVTPKDVDIMVSPNSDLFDADDFLEYIADFEGYTIVKDLTWLCEYLPDMQKRGVSGLVMGHLADGTDVQFIVYDHKVSQSYITRDMDMNICQITMSSSGFIDRSPAYLDGFENKFIECLHDYSEKRQLSRLARMSAKYPHFKVIVK